MTLLTRLAPAARESVIRAGIRAAEADRKVLGTGFLLLGLAETQPLAPPLDGFRISAEAVRAEIDRAAGGPRPSDGELLATLGIDLGEVRRRAFHATSTRLDDPGHWRLSRSRLRPLRVTLTGPATEITLDEGGRKVIEVALWAGRRMRRPRASHADLMWGLLADGTNESVHILRALGVDLRSLWTAVRSDPAAA